MSGKRTVAYLNFSGTTSCQTLLNSIERLMAYLQTKDFNKNASAGDYAGKDRHSIVLFKIKDKKPFCVKVQHKQDLKSMVLLMIRLKNFSL